MVDAAFDRLIGRVGEVAEQDFFGQGQRPVDSSSGHVDAVTQLGVRGVDALEGVGFNSHGGIQFGADDWTASPA